MKIFYVFTAFCLFASLSLIAQEPIETRTVVTGLDVPWEILWGPDDRIWATEREGRVIRVHPETGETVEILQLEDVYSQGESGLLGMAIAEEGRTTRVFLVYTYPTPGPTLERLVRYDYNGTSLGNRTVILENIPASTIHDGSRLAIVGDKLFMTTGDAANAENAQEMRSLSGKTLRFNLDGSAPADNPFADVPSPYNLIWTLGHRNAQGLVYGPNGILYSSEHGPDAEDELNIIMEGRNYGWPLVEGECDQQEELEACEELNVAEPIISWTPTLAVCGLDYYNADAIPEWKNSLLLVTLKERDLRQLQLSTDGRSVIEENIYFNGDWGRLRDLCISPDGRVFVATSNRDGRGSPTRDDDRIIEISSPELGIGPPMLPAESVCAGSETTVGFSIDGDFPVGTEFAVELSDSNGTFALPYEIGSMFLAQDEGPELDVAVTFPSFGEVPLAVRGHRIRVVADDQGNEMFGPSSPVRFFAPPGFVVFPVAGRLCGDEDSVQLRVEPLADSASIRSAVWSNGAVGLTTFVHDSGTYGVTVTDTNGCSYSISIPVEKNPQPTVSIAADKLEFCEGDSAVLVAESEDALVFRWSTEQFGNRIVVKTGGTYWLYGVNGFECHSERDSVTITVHPRPPVPVVQRNGDTLTASVAAVAYQWYLDSLAIPHGTDRSFFPIASGRYQVEVENVQGCRSISGVYQFDLSSVADGGASDESLSIYPHPVGSTLHIRLPEQVRGTVAITISDMSGRRILEVERMPEGKTGLEIPVEDLPSGAYVLRLAGGGVDLMRTFLKE